jgi:peptidyl-tRNA hydrolase, PTH1 family
MIVIIGLGNPGKQYENTRHNTGFFLLDKIWKDGDFSGFESNNKFNAEISKGKWEGREITLFKPQTFMNLSGTAVKSFLEFFKLTADDILVIHDDADISLGQYKIAADSSSAGHRGVENLIDSLGTQKFKRIRVGIANPDLRTKISPEDFVLQKFPEEELEIMEKTAKDILTEVKKITVL